MNQPIRLALSFSIYLFLSLSVPRPYI
uniref:Uncharacterized protein n=1 Tax=Rhizophora mucronata TaxID=61149 RepID=A0A2P2LDS1_RHIMU